ncbi:hypothetical protein SAY86_012243 [Trapa natans]|uniref:Uncharacterized protein n=1 Tax=Trapa natans TaxID=22666 RepID=A0AAN7LZK5_TRANT|nr:hypothetical protein SAY86_012243 [Trapa natans]
MLRSGSGKGSEAILGATFLMSSWILRGDSARAFYPAGVAGLPEEAALPFEEGGGEPLLTVAEAEVIGELRRKSGGSAQEMGFHCHKKSVEPPHCATWHPSSKPTTLR